MAASQGIRNEGRAHLGVTDEPANNGLLQIHHDFDYLPCLEFDWHWPFLAHLEYLASSIIADALFLVVGVPLSSSVVAHDPDDQAIAG